MENPEIINQARMQLIEAGGRASQDLGVGRISGQVLIYLYLQEKECSLDIIGQELGLSKASVSIAARQLEQFGLARKVWKSGDRKNYYRSADNIGSALQKGLMSVVRSKVQLFGMELENAQTLLSEKTLGADSSELEFLVQRINRAKKLQSRFDRLLGNPIIKFFSGNK